MRHFITSTAALCGALLLFLAAGANVSGQEKKDKIAAALPESAPAKPKQARKILIYSRTAGYRHDSIEIGTKAITMMGDKTGAYTAYHTEDETFFEPEKLKGFDAVFMLNTTGDCLRPKKGNAAEVKALEDKYKQSLADFVAGGKGLIGVHSATDTYHGWKDYNMMMGGTFAGHPWHQKVPVKNLAPANVVNAAFDGADFEIADEIYQFRPDTALPGDRKFLLCLDTHKMNVNSGNRNNPFFLVQNAAVAKELKTTEEQVDRIRDLSEKLKAEVSKINTMAAFQRKEANGDKKKLNEISQAEAKNIVEAFQASRKPLGDVLTDGQKQRLAQLEDSLYPVSWISTFGKGRTFYCSLGHRQEIYWNPTILKHYLAGIQYALGDLEADATPTVK